jgi:hypothetical protein
MSGFLTGDALTGTRVDMRTITVTLTLLCFCIAGHAAQAEKADKCKDCRDQLKVCTPNYSAKTCRSEYDLCMKFCRQK